MAKDEKKKEQQNASGSVSVSVTEGTPPDKPEMFRSFL